MPTTPPSLTYVVGDIHGCLDELVALEARIAHHAEARDSRPFLVSVGDLVDRGPDSAAVVRRFREGLAAGTHLAVMGNHEQELLNALAAAAPRALDPIGGWPARLQPTLEVIHGTGRGLARWLNWPEYRDYQRLNWLGQGGAATLSSYDCDPHHPQTWHLPDEDLAFLVHLPFFWQDERVVVTHALATAANLATLRAGDADPSRWRSPDWADAVQGVLWNRRRLEAPPDPQRWHVSGHTPGQRVRRDARRRTIILDTGCVYGRRLTAWCPATDTLLAVPFAGSAGRPEQRR